MNNNLIYKTSQECNRCHNIVPNCPAIKLYWQSSYNSKFLSESIVKQYNIETSYDFNKFISNSNNDLFNNNLNKYNSCSK